MSRAVLLAAICIVFILSAASTVSADFDEGKAAFGRGDYATALREFRPLAAAGHLLSQVYLGYIYKDGLGVPQDYAEAAKWFRMNAERGHVVSQINLGALLTYGKGMPQDYVEAHMWFNLAASTNPGILHNRATTNRDALAQKMTPAQVTEAQKLAREWKPKK